MREYLMFADVCFIERVHAMPRQGVSSTFKFGHIYGFLRACIIENRARLREITPAKWQKALGCLSKGNKNVTKAKAQELSLGLKLPTLRQTRFSSANTGGVML